jgi:hypothetical protein
MIRKGMKPAQNGIKGPDFMNWLYTEILEMPDAFAVASVIPKHDEMARVGTAAG